MPREVIAAVVKIRTKQHFGTVKMHAMAFKECLHQAKKLFSRYAESTNPVKIFVAPEYYFAQYTSTPSKRDPNISKIAKIGYMPISVGERDDLYRDLRRHSRHYSDMILISGSIIFEEGAFPNTKTHNVCPVYAKGNLIHEYFKHRDDMSAMASGSTFVPGTSAPVFAYDGLKFGIEICYDKSADILGKHLGNTGGAKPDIYIHVSAGSTLKVSKAKVGGVSIHCDMHEKSAQVGMRSIDGVADPITEITVGGGKLVLYRGEIT